MSYNLLNYSSTDADKFRYKDLRTIVKYAKPDVLMVCELSDGGAPQLLLDSALNAAGVGTYSRAVFYDGTDTDNMLFYKSGKIKLKSQKQIYTVLRDISQYKMYKVMAPNDTVFIYLHMSHLKAGSFASDENQRNSEVSAFCSNISSLPQNANILFAGDMNLKGSTEPAYNTLTSTTCSHKLNDPINQTGTWYNNNAFSSIHTQSTRTSANPGCCGGSTGGLDDRFDLMLLSDNLISGSNNAKYIINSYKAFGNDNQHMNLAMIDAPVNSVVSTTVSQALFNMSDHLPVLLKLELKASVIGLHEYQKGSDQIKISSVTENENSMVGIYVANEGDYEIQITDLTGKMILHKSLSLKQGFQLFDTRELELKNAVYHVTVSSKSSTVHGLYSHLKPD